MEALWIILVGSVIAISCGLLGSFLVLRKMAMVGDAISHAVLPGIVLAYLFSGSRGTIPMLIGAAALGVLTTLLIELFYKKAKLQIDASIGITFTWLFAIGIIMISLFAGQVDLDQDCVLYGEIAYVPLDLWFIGDFNIGPRTLWISAAMLIVVLLIIIRGYKGLFLTTFNEEYASALGINVAFWHYLLMSSVSLTTVISFESVGAILVVAFLIVPPATAYLLTTKLKQMLWLTALFAVLSSIFGYYLAVLINGSIAGAMATVAGVLFVIVWGITAVRKRRERKVVVENLDMRI
ncbi:MAG: iron ABC transporter [Flavobacteriales bacterium]|nr:iron ABC transporter [Flavobacteriales bacterium]